MRPDTMNQRKTLDQGKMDACAPPAFTRGLLLLCLGLGSLAPGHAQVSGTGASTSPLSILQQAPRVRLDEAPQSAAPALVQPPPPYPDRVTPTPAFSAPARPPVAAEDDDDDDTGREKKPGKVRGIIRAIPFIGKKIAGPGEEATPQPDVAPPVETPFMVDRTFSVDRPPTRPEPLPGSGRNIPSYVFPPTPRSTTPLLPPDGTPAIGIAPSVDLDSAEPALLSVKPERPLATTVTTATTFVTPPLSSPPLRKQPALAGDTTTTLNLDLNETPAPGAGSPSLPVATPAIVETATSPTLEPTDLGMPNPVYEQNDVIRAEYTEAVKKGRAGDYAEAAQMFRDYAENHPSSGLAPRAIFLAAILATDAGQAQEAHALLQERFSTSRYLKELEKRTAGRLPAKATPTPPPDENPRQTASRLENELTQAVGTPEREVPLRLRLGQAYMTLEEYDRALEVLRPAQDASQGRPEEPEILVLISECLIATSKTEQAGVLLSDVIQRFPNVPQRPRAQYDLGLVSEASGNYARARAFYMEVQQQWPDSAEGQQAQQRLKDLAGLTE